MKKLPIVLFLILTINLIILAQAETPAILYKIKPIPAADRINLEVSVSLKASDDKAVKVALPRDNYGVPKLERFIASFAGEDGTVVNPGKDASERSVQPNAAGEIRLKYTLSYDPALLNDYTFGPNVGPQHFHVAGCQVFLRIGDVEQKYRFVVEIAGAPKGWSTYSSLGPDPRHSEITASVDDLTTTTAFGGSRNASTPFIVHGKPVSVFIQGNFAIPPDRVFAAVKKIVKLQRDFFNDYGQKFYNVVILPKDDNVAGTRIENLFACFVKKDVTPEQLYVLLSHEMFHNWLTSGIVKKKPGETSLRYAWFYEGFNDYLARRLLLDAGIISKVKFAYLANRDIINIADNPNRATTYDDLVTAAETGRYNHAFNKLSYYRGGLMALNWDAQIAKSGKGHGIGDLIKRVYGAASKNGGITEEELFALAAEYGVDGRGDFERYILRGESIPASPGALGKSYVLREMPVPSFETGFISANRKITSVEADSASFKAGLREGMEIARTENSNRFGGAWDPDLPYVVIIKSEGKERRLEFFPRGKDLKLKIFQRRGQPARR